VSSADCPDNPLPDPSCLHLSINTAALAELRSAKQRQLQEGSSQAPTGDAAAAASAAVLGSAGAAATGGLWGCAAEWAGLSCRHAGSWQLSLLYDPEELGHFSMVRRSHGCNASAAASQCSYCACPPHLRYSLLWCGWACGNHNSSWPMHAPKPCATSQSLAMFAVACCCMLILVLQAWRFLVQLRWVRRRLDAARHGACKGAASQHDLAGQDAREQAAVAAAMQAVAASKGLAHNRAAGALVICVVLQHRDCWYNTATLCTEHVFRANDRLLRSCVIRRMCVSVAGLNRFFLVLLLPGGCCCCCRRAWQR
jgi:hypothetical protein